MAALTFGGYAAQVTGNAKAAELLEQTRAALGGEAAIDKVQGLSATGSVTRAAGNMQLAGDITLQFQLPDRMLRTDSLSPDGGMTLVTDQGFNGATLLRGSRTFNAPPGRHHQDATYTTERQRCRGPGFAHRACGPRTTDCSPAASRHRSRSRSTSPTAARPKLPTARRTSST
jgi:hypothetical protein